MLKLEQKVQIIALREENPGLKFRQFTELVKYRLKLNVSRATIQRIIKDKVKILYKLYQ